MERRFQAIPMSAVGDLRQPEALSSLLIKFTNLDDPLNMLRWEKGAAVNNHQELSSKITHGTAFPDFIWLQSEISIKNIKLKNNVLADINHLVETNLKDTSVENAEVGKMGHYTKVFNFHNLLSMSINRDSRSHELDDDFTLIGNKSELEENNSVLAHSIQNHTPIPQEDEITTSKGQLLNVQQPAMDTATLSLGSQNFEPRSPKSPESSNDRRSSDKWVNSFINKSIYGKLRKNRELTSSTSSIGSGQLSWGKRFSTLSISKNMRDGRNSKVGENRSFSTPTQKPIPPLPVQELTMSAQDRSENQYLKYEYYLQLIRLQELLRKLAETKDLKSRQLLEFLRRTSLEMILIDMRYMILDYLELKSNRIM